jgi:dephospho-CoA kinase
LRDHPRKEDTLVVEVGLTGGIGSGKSEVTRLLASYGAIIIDADVLAREVVGPGTPGLARVVEEFGADILRPDGSLDRDRLAELVFGDEEARRRLNAIVHPLVGRRTAELKAAAADDAVLVHDVPLLVEAGLTALYDLVVVVDAPPEVQLRRLVSLRGMTEPAARARIAAQASREQRLAAADVVIDNSGTLEELEAQVRELWEELRIRV